jgi:hypothetical protein
MRALTLGSLLALAWLASACSVEGDDPKADPGGTPEVGAADFAWNGTAMRNHRDAPSALSFPVPVTGFRVTAMHFDPATGPIKMKHELTLSQDRREVIRIEVWNDTQQLGLDAFFDEYLRFMASPESVVERARAGRAGVDAIVVRQPRSEQSAPRRHTVFALDGQIVRVTAIDDTDPTTAKIYDRVTRNLELGGAK